MQWGTGSRGGPQGVGLLTLLAGLVLSVGGTGYGADNDRSLAVAAHVASLTDDVNALLNLERSTVVTLDVGGAAAAPLSITVPLDGEPYTLDLAPVSIRSERYQVKAQLADGSYVSVEPGPIRTLRGTVTGIDGSIVAASLSDDGLYARIILPGDVTYWIEPLPFTSGGQAAAGGAQYTPAGMPARAKARGSVSYVVYRSDDVVPGGGTCIALHSAGPLPDGRGTDAAGEPTYGDSGSVAAGGPFIAELAIDADYEYFQDFGSVEATVEQIENIINAMNAQYERDVGIRHFITTIIVRTTEPDPYSSTDPEELLVEFRDHWRCQQIGIRRDVAQLFTGKNLSGAIGIAWVGSVCHNGTCSLTGIAYSVVESNCFRCGSLACKTDLSAHELGHNWGAGHCGGNDCFPACPDYTMNCTLTCRNRFHETETIPSILAHRDSRSCLGKDVLRRIILLTEADTVEEGGPLQFTAIAEFPYREDVDVTAETIWSVDRSWAASIDSNGLFTAFDVDGDTCVTVSALYMYDGSEFTRDKTITVIDTDAPYAIVANVPPDGAIDARQPSEPEGLNPAGWESIDITFNGDLCRPTAADFDVTTVTLEGGVEPGPPIASLEYVGVGLRTVRLLLSEIMEAGAWTTITHVDSGAGIRVGYLPGDVDADGTAGALDIFALIEALDGAADPLPTWSTDIDRSGQTTPADILRLIDLLGGAEAYESWLGRRLP